MDVHLISVVLGEIEKIAREETEEGAKNPLYESVLKKSPVDVRVYKAPADKHQMRTNLLGPHFLRGEEKPEERGIYLDKQDANALAHEIGHAKMDEGFLGALSQSPIARMLNELAPIASLAASAASKTPKQQALSILLPMAATLPTLANEAAASVIGYNVLKEMDADKKELEKYRNDNAKAWMTYASQPLVTAMAGAMGAGARELMG